jgi:hypothetical protein
MGLYHRTRDAEQAKQVAHVEIKADNPVFDVNKFNVDVSAPIYLDAHQMS